VKFSMYNLIIFTHKDCYFNKNINTVRGLSLNIRLIKNIQSSVTDGYSLVSY
jgi:hypothetical protein